MAENVCVLEIQIHEASEWLGFNQDPYVQIRALPSGTEVKTLHVWGGGVKPIWDAKKHNTKLIMKMKPTDHTLVFEIKNKNNVLNDELIGSGILDMGMIVEGSYETSSPIPLPLQTGGGTLVLTVFKRMTNDDQELQQAILMSSGLGGSDLSSMFSTSSSLTQQSNSMNRGEGNTLGGNGAPQTAEERRQAAARAAEARQTNWRQGGSKDSSKAASINERRQKDELIGKIEAIYASKGHDAPFGLGGSSVDTLQKHLKGLSNSAAEDSKRQKKEDIIASKLGVK